MALIRLVILHAQLLPAMTPQPVCDLISGSLCEALWVDPFTFYVCFWGMLQASWVTMLLFVQLLQIAKAQTTYENMTANRNFNQSSFVENDKITTALAAAVGAPNNTDGGSISGASSRSMDEGWWRKTTKLLGVDVFWKTAHGNKTSRRAKNPFSHGVVGNCGDFWGGSTTAWRPPVQGEMGMLDGKQVDWGRVYEVPRIGRSRGREDV